MTHPRSAGRIPRITLLSLVVIAAGVTPGAARAQSLTGYTLGVGTYASASDFAPPGSTWLGRGRLMLAWDPTPMISVDAAYEHIASRHPVGGGFGLTSPGGVASATDWAPLEWPIHEGARSDWRHRFDRLHLNASLGDVDVIVGRQAISWATTLFLTPADPFAPFDPSDPFREYRGGVDAVRLRIFPGPFTEVEVVARAADLSRRGSSGLITETAVTALARVSTSRAGWAVGGWAGAVHDTPGAALFATGSIGSTSLRTEAALREGVEGGAVVRMSLGVDRIVQAGGRDASLLAEVQYDGYGAARADEFVAIANSEPFTRGDMQLFGRWTLASHAQWQWHPLVSVDALALLNLDDGSALLAPGISWSASSSTSTRLGLFVGAGADAVSSFEPGSEYGSVPTLAYLSLSFYF